MGGTSARGRRRWARRSCRTGGGAGGVVRRTVAAPATTAPRVTEGFAHVDKQRRVHGVLSDFRCNSGSTDHLSLDIKDFKHKSSHRSSVRCLPSAQRNETEISHMQPVARGAQVDKTFNDKGLCHASRTVSGMPIRPQYYLSSPNNNFKNPPTVKSCSEMSDFSYQLVRCAKRSASPKMGLTSTNCSLSEKMSLLRQPRHGDNHQNQNRISALNRRHKIVNPRGATDLLNKDKVHEQLNSSLERHSQALLNNALIREKQLCCSDMVNQKAPEQLWSSTYSESEKILCFSSSDSNDDLQVSSSSDTSDSSNLSSLGVIASDQWNMTFKKGYYPHAACLDSTSVIYAKEIGQDSPISVLQPLSEDCSDTENIRREPADPYDLQLRLELGTFAPTETAAELVEDILEGFEDDEEREFSYLLDMLIASGIHGTSEDQMYKVCQSLDYPAGDDVFEKLEKKYIKVVQWSRSDRKLLFDMVNTILSQILAPCLNMQPWVNTTRNLAPLWGSEGLLEKLLKVLVQRREQLAPSDTKPEKKGFDMKWPDIADCIDRAGRDIERMIKDDLLEELVLELLFS
ncbi:uncharacterized protein LOC8057371 isoform X2 [Sorghum bicolor]|uniref:DUF4378 domain-containing protein n=1 Tax=Sorghum bicolor TaxID=4558 RepID=C5WV21_SORBI|nr:uncharacterized protein LOC8057371 isoform X2 [Sorghum bicolor]EER90628.2 hypothetical protein SORBI_3001G035500 [Sorghum bicolor]|eukprot:XP_021306548.1 uncharacterized protein LOC8057371 isoform X2 [Sorghum bicolor]